MAQLRQHFDELDERDVDIVVVGPEKPARFERYWRDEDLPFVGLPDPEHRVARQFGQQVKILRLGRMPAQLLIDREGIVRHAHYGASMSDIPPIDELLALIDGLPPAADSADPR